MALLEATINGIPVSAYPVCACGCENLCNAPGSTFRPGHDARLVSKLLKSITAGELTIDQAARKAVTGPLAQKLRDAHKRAEIKAQMKAAGATNRSANRMAKGATAKSRTYGSIKIGRWEYPTITENKSGITHRNSKRDGSGEWVEVAA